ncbi:THO complex subunit 1-like [Apostichopus japonicus]|uniref:THO complex subunit 1-like n=1 Tax=Stichopus japonicus TaxID=307972 RepID=UPI003AB3BE40
MEYEEGEMSEGPSSHHIDYQLYRKFWSLQDYFRDPVQCYTKDKWKQFMKNTRSVLAACSSMKLETDSTSSSSTTTKGKEPMTTKQKPNVQDKSSVFFAKYLTSEKLFDLQLSDSSFRRYVLVQFLILFQYLSQQVKFKTATLVLTEEMQLFMKTTLDKVYELLKETPPDGQKFAADIKHILDREEHWNNWKNEGCPSFVKEKPKEESEPNRRPRKRTLGEELELNPTSEKVDMGSPELTRLWNQSSNNLEACRSEKRMYLPSLETFFEEAIEQADPEAMIEDDFKVVNNSNYAWQALRLLARRSPHFFQTTSIAAQPSVKTIPAYLELMATKLAKEMPQFNNVEEIKTEAMDNDELLKAGEEEKEVTKVSPEDMDLVALKLGANWKTLAVELGLTEDEISNTQTEFAEVKEQSRHVLKSWLEEKGNEACEEVLVKALTESGLNDIVQSVFQKKKLETDDKL